MQRLAEQVATFPYRLETGLWQWPLLITLLLTPSLLPAQYSIDWSTLDGGGGVSTDTVYSVTGTNGQRLR